MGFLDQVFIHKQDLLQNEPIFRKKKTIFNYLNPITFQDQGNLSVQHYVQCNVLRLALNSILIFLSNGK